MGKQQIWMVSAMAAAMAAVGCERRAADPPSEVAVDRSGAAGKSACDPDVGKMAVKVKELCAGTCIAQHEAVHVADTAACCTALYKCVTKPAASQEEAAVQREECIETYNEWHRARSAWTECNADKREVACLTPVVKTQNDRDSASVCSIEVESALNEATARMDVHCDKPKNVTCPFK